MKTCVTCHQSQPEASFAVRRAARDGLQDRCRECFREWYRAHRESARQAIDARRAASRTQIQQRLVVHLQDNPCVDCGESDLRVLDFDHRVGTDKRYGVARMMTGGWTWEAVEAEIAKCEVRCANCHRRRTAERAGHWRHRWVLAQSDGFDPVARLHRILAPPA